MPANSRKPRSRIMNSFNAKRMLVALTGAVAFVAAVQAADISGAGATFPYPIYSKWADAYRQKTGIGLNYQSIGSGGGIRQIKAKTVTFGASDMPLKPEELQEAGLVQFPMVIGGVVPVVNIKAVQAGQLVLDGATVAAIYLGDITRWNDPRIRKLNPKLPLPDSTIAPVYRSDGSGTNFLFSDYLSKSSPKFQQSVGANTSVQWPVGIGAKGNEGVANMTHQTDGAIGYVEYAYAKQTNMAYCDLINRAGKTVAVRQADQHGVLRPHQPGGQDGRARRRGVPGSGRQCRLGPRTGLPPDPHRSAGREELADHRRKLHSGVRRAAGSGRNRRGAQVL